MRIASLLRHHLYEQPFPEIRSPETEFLRLVYYLELLNEGMELNSFNSAVALSWHNEEAHTSVPKFWFNQLHQFVTKSEIAAKKLIANQHISWKMPKLLSLPKEYEKIFTVSSFSCSQW